MASIYNADILQSSNYGSLGAPEIEKTRHNTDMAYQLFSIEDACKILTVGRTTLYKFINRKELPAVKLGSKTSIRGSDLMNFIDLLPQYEGKKYGF